MSKLVKRWYKIKKGTPAYAEGYRWFDGKPGAQNKRFKNKPTNVNEMISK